MWKLGTITKGKYYDSKISRSYPPGEHVSLHPRECTLPNRSRLKATAKALFEDGGSKLLFRSLLVRAQSKEPAKHLLSEVRVELKALRTFYPTLLTGRRTYASLMIGTCA